MYEFRLPDIGEGVAQGEVVKWHVKEGDAVTEDQPLVSILTDKANVEIPCPVKGKVVTIHAAQGRIVPVGGLLVTLEAEGGAAPPPSHGASHPEAAPPTPVARAPAPPAPVPQAAPPPQPPAPAPAGTLQAGGGQVVTTPAIRRKANELGIDLKSVKGTGPSGRITEADLDNFAKNRGGASAPHAALVPSPPAPGLPPQPLAVSAAPIKEMPLMERVPIRGLRRVIAEHMALANQRAAPFTYVEEIDVSELVKVRERSKKRFEEKGIPLSYLPFIIKSVVEALKAHPRLNAYMDDEKGEIILCHSYNIGVAAAAPDGLIVPVIKDADKKSIATIARELDDLSSRGRAGKLTREELTGSTFTISSLGALGGLLATPILNYPEVAILGVHKIERRPVVLTDGTLGVAHMMNLSITLDHRAIDGYDGALFMASVKSRLEDPHQLLLELR